MRLFCWLCDLLMRLIGTRPPGPDPDPPPPPPVPSILIFTRGMDGKASWVWVRAPGEKDAESRGRGSLRSATRYEADGWLSVQVVWGDEPIEAPPGAARTLWIDAARAVALITAAGYPSAEERDGPIQLSAGRYRVLVVRQEGIDDHRIRVRTTGPWPSAVVIEHRHRMAAEALAELAGVQTIVTAAPGLDSEGERAAARTPKVRFINAAKLLDGMAVILARGQATNPEQPTGHAEPVSYRIRAPLALWGTTILGHRTLAVESGEVTSQAWELTGSGMAGGRLDVIVDRANPGSGPERSDAAACYELRLNPCRIEDRHFLHFSACPATGAERITHSSLRPRRGRCPTCGGSRPVRRPDSDMVRCGVCGIDHEGDEAHGMLIRTEWTAPVSLSVRRVSSTIESPVASARLPVAVLLAADLARVPRANALLKGLRAGGMLDRLVMFRDGIKVQTWDGAALDGLDLAAIGKGRHGGWESSGWADALRRAAAPGRWRRPAAPGLLVVIIAENSPPPVADDPLSTPAGRWATVLELGRDLGGPLHLVAFQALGASAMDPAGGRAEMLRHLVLLGRQATHWHQLIHTWSAAQTTDEAGIDVEVAAIIAIAGLSESEGDMGTIALRPVAS